MSKDKIRIINPAPGGPAYTSPERVKAFLAGGKGRMQGPHFEFFPEECEARIRRDADDYHQQRYAGDDHFDILVVTRNPGGGRLTYTQWRRG